MRGISFKVENAYDHILDKIFHKIKTENFIWNISEQEAYKDINKSLFEEEVLENLDFFNYIKSCEYYIISLNLKAYIGEIGKIGNYNEFLKSNCEIIVLICDSIYVEIYCKNITNIEIIRANALKNNFVEVNYITDENDERNIFSVL